MKILITGGGTAGHINPALAIADHCIKMNTDTQILFVGNKDSVEEKLVPKSGYKLETITISGFQRKISVQNIVKNAKTVVRIFTSSANAKKIIRDFKPDVCIGTGGYVCGPVLKTAAKMGIPCLIHESNSLPGMTVKMLAKKMHTVMIANEDSKKYFPDNINIKLTGNPVRAKLFELDKQEIRKKLRFDDRPLILSFGGSLGAKAINDVMLELLKRSAKDQKYQHIHGFGLSKFNADFKDKTKDINENSNLRILEYIENMPEILVAADLVISRAGAITITEIAALKKASILIPSPYVADNHQYYNAMSLVKLGAGDIIEEKDLNSKLLIEKVDRILKDRNKLSSIGENASGLYVNDVLDRIYDCILVAVKQK